MSASFRVEVDDTVLRKLISSTPEHIKAFMDAQAEDMKNDIILSFGESPSPPGFPPGVDTGTLRDSIDWESDGTTKRYIYDGVWYGAYLEFGTERAIAEGFEGFNEEGRGGMAPRPFMGPAFERKRRNIGEQAQRFGLVKP